jgi:hypothetical protein
MVSRPSFMLRAWPQSDITVVELRFPCGFVDHHAAVAKFKPEAGRRAHVEAEHLVVGVMPQFQHDRDARLLGPVASQADVVHVAILEHHDG